MRNMPTEEATPRHQMNRLLRRAGLPHAPDTGQLPVGDRLLSPRTVIETLRPFMRARRMERLASVVRQRTRTVIPVIEGLVNTGNVSAVMRSAEGLGYQELHVVEGNHERYKHSQRTAQGAGQWLDVHRWETPAACADALHARGYQILTLYLSDAARPLTDVDCTQPTALVVGNEKNGVTDAMRAAADGDVVIPMHGFTESFNVSVAAALALYQAQQDRLQRQGYHADLSEAAQEHLLARFCLQSVRHAARIIDRELPATSS